MRGTVTILLTALVLGACGGPLKYSVASSAVAPGADANIVADVNDAQNQTQLEVTIKNLVPAERIKDGMKSYTAWYRRDSGASWSRVGGVKYDTGSRGAKLSGSVPERAFDFSITAEESDAPVSPSPSVVFSQRVAK
jgi:hypothetical protein